MWHPLLAAVLAALAGAPAGQSAGEIEVSSVLVRLIEQREVPAEEAGVLAAVEVSDGQMVQRDDLLAQIVDAEARIAVERAKIELDIARKNVENDVGVRFAAKSLEVAKAELERSLDSIAKYPKSISDSEMDRLRLVVERGELEVEQAEYEQAIAAFTQRIKENEYEAAMEKLRRRRITAPVAGVVVDVQRRPGEWVEPGETVLRVLRIDRLRAEGFLPVAALAHELDGRAVRLVVDLPGQAGAEFPGRVVFLSPEIDPVNAQVRVWAEIENRGLRLRPGMRARMIVDARPADGSP